MTKRSLQRRMAMSRRILNRRLVPTRAPPACPPTPDAPRPLSDREATAVLEHDVDQHRRNPEDPMTLLEHALQHLDNKIAEEEARLEDARRMLGFLQQERASLLAEAAREQPRHGTRTDDHRHTT